MGPGYSLWMELWPASMEPEFALRMEPRSSISSRRRKWLQWSRSLHSGWNAANKRLTSKTCCFNGAGVCTPDGTEMVSPAAGQQTLQWSRSLHSGWNCSLKIAKENKPCKRLFRAPERRGRIFLSIQHGGRKNSFILADCHCENPPL